MNVNGGSIVAEIARENPGTVKVFQRHRIDFCCNGNRPLTDACANAQRDLDEVLQDLIALEDNTTEPEWDTQPLVALIDHIISRYHDRLRQDLPTLEELAQRVALRHGNETPSLIEVQNIFNHLADEMITHMRKEEVVLFPMIEKLEEAEMHGALGAAVPHIGGPIAVMEDDHREVGEMLSKLWKLTNGFQPPADACTSYRGLFEGLRELESDTHRHIHLENNILHRRGLHLAEKLGLAPTAV